jgi:hypothetical protein
MGNHCRNKHKLIQDLSKVPITTYGKGMRHGIIWLYRILVKKIVKKRKLIIKINIKRNHVLYIIEKVNQIIVKILI